MASPKVKAIAAKVRELSPAGQGVVIKALEHMQSNEEGVVTDSLASMIKTTISHIKVGKGDLKKKRDELDDRLMTNEEYKNASNNSKEAARMKKDMRKRAMQQDSVAAKLNAELSDLRGEVKGHQMALFDYVSEYYRQTKATEITDSAGVKHPILVQAKINV